VTARPATERIAAEGTDPRLLERALAWLVRPRYSADAARRACRDRADGEPTDRLRSVLPSATTTDRQALVPVVEAWRRRGVTVALVGDAAYPARLGHGWPHTDGPVLLAWTGQPPDGAPAVGLVGARRATAYGTGVAAWLAATVARAGGRVVSGGARGIDAAAHEAALETPGGTSVVLGCGHDVAYPRSHAAPGGLFDRVLDDGGTLLSELLPHEPPHAGNVRARNRIVAGLVDALVVVEGGARSGALLTAGAAADRGTAVLAVPGDVRAPGSTAPHRLLAEGAAPCRGPDDLLLALGVAQREATPEPGTRAAGPAGTPPGVLGLPDDVAAELTSAWPRPVQVDDLAERTGRGIPGLLAALTQAKVAGLLAESVDGVRLRRAPGR
jgi:DNA processing protein